MRNYIYSVSLEANDLPFNVRLIGESVDQGKIERLNGFPYYQWIHCTKGSGKLLIEGKEFIISSGTGFYIAKDYPHEYFPLETPWETHWISFDGYGVEEILKSVGLDGFGVYNLWNIKHIDELLLEIYHTAIKEDESSLDRNSVKLYNFLLELKKSIRNTEKLKNKVNYDKVEKVIFFMEQNFKEYLTIDMLASEINVSSQYLCRIFKKVMCMRPFEYLNKYRIQKAQGMLIENHEIMVKEVSKQVGFEDASYFCLMFKKYVGMSPIEFRNVSNNTSTK